MEFHPTFGKSKTGPGVRLRKSPQEGEKSKSKGHETHIEGLTDEDIIMFRQIVQLLDTQYLN